MTFQQLKYLVEIFQCGSITGAAQKLFISQPSLSKSVRDLETELGITIFERSRTGVSCTAEGMEVLEYANSILEQTVSMKAHFASRAESEMLRLSISAQHYIFLTDAIIDFVNQSVARTERFSVTFRECTTSQVIEDVISRRSMVGILYVSESTRSFMLQLLRKNELEFHQLGLFSSHVYLRKGHPLSGKAVLTEAELRPYPCIRYEQDGDSLNFSEEVAVPDDASQRIFVTDRSTLLSIVKNTDAYNIGSGCLLPHIIDPDIITVPFRSRTDQMEIGWIQIRDAVLPPAVAQYTHLMENSIQKVLSGCDGADI